MLLRRMKTDTLLVLGLAGLAIHGATRMLLNRAGHGTDAIDFALGMLFGVSASLLLMVAWRNGRKLRGQGGHEGAG